MVGPGARGQRCRRRERRADVSWKHHLRAARRQAAEAARELADNAQERANHLADDSEQLQAARRVAETAAGRATEAAGAARSALTSGLDRTGSTAAGSRVGLATRQAAKMMQGLPGLSAAVDAVMEKNGVGELRDQLEADPSDPMRCIQLAVALRRAERDLRAYAAARTLVNPGSLVLRESFRAAAGLGAQTQEPAQLRLLRRAFDLATRRLAADPADGHALHSLARIYLIQGQPRHAAKLAKKAARVDPEHAGLPLITLARAYLEVGQMGPARRAAEMATRQGMTLGYEILATTEAAFCQGRGASTVRAEAELLGRISDEDRRRYDGVSVSGGEVGRGVLASQLDKSRAVGAIVSVRARDLRDGVVARLDREAARHAETRGAP